MARLSDKEFAITFELRQLQADRNRLERIKERTDSDLDETRQRIRALKKQLEKSQKPAKKKAVPKKTKTIYSQRSKRERKLEDEKTITVEAEGLKLPEPEESKVKVDASSMTAVENSVELKDKSTKKAPKEKAEDEKTDPAE